MAVKLIALDMDGTTLNPQHQITSGVKVAIERAKAAGIVVVLASGRPYIGMQKYIVELQLNQPGQYCISYNGALVQHAEDGRCLTETTLGLTDYRRMKQLADELGVNFQGLDKTHLYTSNQDISRHTVHEAELTGIPLRYRNSQQMDAELRFPKLMMVADQSVLDTAIKQIPEALYQEYTLVKSSDHYLEILDKRVSKGEAVRQLAEKLGILPEEVLAVGDHENDLTMLQWAGYGVAMGNAIPKVKQAARYQTKSNNEDGVAWAIEHWALNSKR